MPSRTTWYLVAAALIAALPVAAQTRGGAPDTVDVKVGSNLVQFPKEQPAAQRSIATMTMNGQSRTMPVMVFSYRYDDSGSVPLMTVTGKPESTGDQGGPPPTVSVFDRNTLALKQMLSADESTVLLTMNGASVHGQVPGPGGSRQVDLTLSEPAFVKGLADLVAESLPRRKGVVYRLPLWSLSGAAVEYHLFQFVRQEDVEVLGKSYPSAWVMEDHNPDGTLAGTMWLVNGPPRLVRWILNRPGGVTVNLEQEPAGPSR